MLAAFLVINFIFNNKEEVKISVISTPLEFITEKGEKHVLRDVDTFSPDYTEGNKNLALNLGISEDEAFILGNLGKYWVKNLLDGRKVLIKDNDIIYYKFRYLVRFKNTPFALKDGKPLNEQAYNRQLASVRRGHFVILDLDTDIAYPISKENRAKVKNFVVVRKNHVKKSAPKVQEIAVTDLLYKPVYKSGSIKIIVSDLTTKTKPDRNCTSEICKEIVSNINSAKNTIDMAIYGYSSTPAIEKAINNAKLRGVKIRLVYDLNAKGENIYPDTNSFIGLIPDSVSDRNSAEANNTMHNKFYIIDGKTVITGSANLSHTDMSGFNSNSIAVINSKNVADYYTKEFNQMYSGKFHSDKKPENNKTCDNITIFFSPQDKAVEKGVLPLIKNAKRYIYIPAFVITEKRITEELIKAKKRGVDVKIIADALNTVTKH